MNPLEPQLQVDLKCTPNRTLMNPLTNNQTDLHKLKGKHQLTSQKYIPSAFYSLQNGMNKIKQNRSWRLKIINVALVPISRLRTKKNNFEGNI